jgi:hypothetical protein
MSLLHHKQKRSENREMGEITKERVIQILQDYVYNDSEATELSYVRDVLVNICGCDEAEMRELGFGYIFDATDEDDE